MQHRKEPFPQKFVITIQGASGWPALFSLASVRPLIEIIFDTRKKLPAKHSYFRNCRKTGLSGDFVLTCLIALGNTANAADREAGIPVYAAGDIADCRYVHPKVSGAEETAALVVAEIAQNEDAVVLNLGDSTYPDGRPEEFTGCYHPTWGRFKNRTYPVPGNHEYKTPGAHGYFHYFGAAAAPERGGYYSFQLGEWHVIALNSNLQDEDFAKQMDWLKSTLQQNAGHCTLAYWHHPVFSSGEYGYNDTMLPAWRMLVEAKAELVLAAHEHHYERFAPLDGSGRRDEAGGIRQFVVGTGGARLRMIRLFRKNSEAASNDSHGVLKLVLKPGAYTWQFLPVSPDTPADSGSGSCH